MLALMQQSFHIKALPILISVQAGERIEKVTLIEHQGGLACTINPQASKTLVKEIIHFIEAYAVGSQRAPPPLEWRGCTPFTRNVLLKLATLAFGETQTYGQIAHAVGSPQGARAVGGACGRNPFPFFLPCHRVVGSQGIGGFSAGLNFKQFLLNFEQIEK